MRPEPPDPREPDRTPVLARTDRHYLWATLAATIATIGAFAAFAAEISDSPTLRQVILAVLAALITGGFAFVTVAAGEHTWRARRQAETTEASMIIGDIPPRNPDFTNREEALDLIRATLKAQDGPPETLLRSCALHGLGGVGKTSLAAEYAHRFGHDYALVWWVRADNAATAAEDLTRLATALDPEGATGPVDVMTLLRRELARHQPWLLVFDNAEDPAVIREHLPTGSSGDVLVTSRQDLWRGLAHESLSVELLSPEDAVMLLRRRTGSEDDESAADVAHRLGRLPLALAQAAAYVAKTGTSLAHFAELAEERLSDMLSRGPLPADYAETVATTWSLTYSAASAQATGARELLSLLSYLSPDAIPRPLIAQQATVLPDPLFTVAADPIAYDLAVAALRQYSLIGADEDQLSLHRLVQLTVRINLAPAERAEWARTALAMLARAFPEDPLDVVVWPRCAKLIPHVIEATNLARDVGVEDDGLLYRAGDYLAERGVYTQAVEFLEAAAGDDIARISRLAWALHRLGDLPRALTATQRALRAREQLLGTGDPALIEELLQLGSGFREMSQIDTSIESLQRALEIGERHFGVDDARLAPILAELGNTQRRAGTFGQATRTMERALALGDLPGVQVAHLHRITGYVRRDARDLEGAREHLDLAIEWYDRVFGPGSVEGLRAEEALSEVFCGLRASGPAAYEHAYRVMEALTELHGPNHSNVASAQVSLATALTLIGRPAEAIPLLESAAAAYAEWRSPDHPYVAQALVPLAAAQRTLGRLDEAMQTLARARLIAERRRGPRHPDFATVLEEEGRLIRAKGRRREAEALERQARDIREEAATA